MTAAIRAVFAARRSGPSQKKFTWPWKRLGNRLLELTIYYSNSYWFYINTPALLSKLDIINNISDCSYIEPNHIQKQTLIKLIIGTQYS